MICYRETKSEYPRKSACILDEAKAHDKPLPSLRSLRAQVGGGSLTTISEAVKSWRFAQLEAAGQIPQISEKTKVHLADVVWQAMMPILQTQVEGVRQKAEAGIEIERAESRKLFSASEEMLREAESKEAMIGQLNDRLQRQSRECAELRTKVAMLEEQLAESQQQLKVTKERERQAVATINSLRELAESLRTQVLSIHELIPDLVEKMRRKEAGN